MFFGSRLMSLGFQQIRREADFRYGLLRCATTPNRSPSPGRGRELHQVRRRFSAAFKNFNS